MENTNNGTTSISQLPISNQVPTSNELPLQNQSNNNNIVLTQNEVVAETTAQLANL